MDFMKFKNAVAKRFQEMQQHKMFRTSITKDALWDRYLRSFPEGTNPIYRERTERDCNCCKQFIRAVGNAVAIIDDELVSIWDVDIDDPTYQHVANCMSAAVLMFPIESVFMHTEATAGTDKNFEQLVDGVKTWNHLHVNIDRRHVADKFVIAQRLGELNTSCAMLQRALNEIDNESLRTVLELIDQNSLYRGQEHRASVQAFFDLKAHYSISSRQNLFSWKNYDSHVARIRNTVIGTLLVDLSEGVPLERAVKSFEDKVAPTNYKRPTAIVTQSMINSAKEKIEALGLTSSLERRFATIDDITVNNILFADRSSPKHLIKDAFSDLPTKASKPKLDRVEDVTIDQFLEHILPKAESVEIFVENRHANNFVSLIAPANPTAQNMFKWGNKFSWSYSGNVTDSIKERVKAAGGNVTGELCCRLAWEYKDDLDFHMQEMCGADRYNSTHIYYGQRSSVNGGKLDVDANGMNGMMDHPVENIFYEKLRTMRDGQYRLFVHNYNRRSTGVGFEVEIDILGTVHHLVYEKAIRQGEEVNVAVITVNNGAVTFESPLQSVTASKDYWNVKTQQFQKVNVVMNSPNYWDGHGVGNKHVFFMIDGCKNGEQARGFYNEFLINELDQHRKVIEMVGNRMLTDKADYQLSGLGFSTTQRNSVLCRVNGSFTRTVNITF